STLAPALPDDSPRASGATAAVVERPIPCSAGQQRLWFLEQMEPGTALYNIPHLVRLSGPVQPALLERALNQIVARHEALRTRFVAVGSEPTQVITDPALARLDLPITDLTAVDSAQREAELMRLAREEVR